MCVYVCVYKIIDCAIFCIKSDKYNIRSVIHYSWSYIQLHAILKNARSNINDGVTIWLRLILTLIFYRWLFEESLATIDFYSAEKGPNLNKQIIIYNYDALTLSLLTKTQIHKYTRTHIHVHNLDTNRYGYASGRDA